MTSSIQQHRCAERAELIFAGGRVHTVDVRDSVAEALAVGGGWRRLPASEQRQPARQLGEVGGHCEAIGRVVVAAAKLPTSPKPELSARPSPGAAPQNLRDMYRANPVML